MDVEKGRHSHHGSTDDNPPPYTEDRETLPLYTDQAQPTTGPAQQQSVMDEIKTAKESSNSLVDFCGKFWIVIFGTVGCTIFVALLLAIPIFMIAIGSIYLGDCPRNWLIPIYFIVAGCFGALSTLSNLSQQVKNRHYDQLADNIKPNPFDGLLGCFLCIWFILGSVWIYSINGDFTTDDPEDPDYCNPVLYYSAFWITTLTYIFMLVSLLSCCCTALCIGCSLSKLLK